MNIEKHILVVDDDSTVLETVCEGLLIHGFNVIPAKSPPDALSKIENKNIYFALLDLDLGWPDMNGIQLGHKLKSIYPNISILIMTGYHNVKTAVEATNEYSYEHMIKPFQVDQVLTVMERNKKINDLSEENHALKVKILELEREIEKIKVKEQEKPSDNPEYRSQPVEKNQLHKVALKSYERQKKSVTNKTKTSE